MAVTAQADLYFCCLHLTKTGLLTTRQFYVVNSFLASGDFSHLLINFANSLDPDQDRPRTGPTESRSWSGSKLFDTLIVFLKEFFEKDHFEKKSADDKSLKNYPACNELRELSHLEDDLKQWYVFSKIQFGLSFRLDCFIPSCLLLSCQWKLYCCLFPSTATSKMIGSYS